MRKILPTLSSPDFPAERLIACRNPFLAQHRRTKREALLRATEVELQKIVLATKRQKRPLRGKAKIALLVGRLIERFKVAKKIFVLEIQAQDFAWKRNETKIAEEAALDGMYVVRTSVDQSAMSASEAVERYKDLGAVEQAFRCIKTVDLKVRPIHHRLENRVRAHVFCVCSLTTSNGTCARPSRRCYLTRILPREPREDVVSPKKPSPSATRKARTKKTLDGAPVDLFQTLLADLSTIVRNSITPNIEGAPAWQK